MAVTGVAGLAYDPGGRNCVKARTPVRRSDGSWRAILRSLFRCIVRNGKGAAMPLTSPRFAGNARLQSAAENKPPLKIGEPKGQAVELLQQALADLGYQMPISFREGK